ECRLVLKNGCCPSPTLSLRLLQNCSISSSQPIRCCEHFSLQILNPLPVSKLLIQTLQLENLLCTLYTVFYTSRNILTTHVQTCRLSKLLVY
uniref:Uncharacterized protein n=1 Tax=Denticeps clupeoides TaxID=299321 RepID=A0AAY4A744_9TELE